MENFNKPYYLVDFDMSICNFEILINDLLAFKSMDGGSLSSHYPINHLILESGIQEISIKIFPLKTETTLRKDAYLKIKVHSYNSATQNYEDLNQAFIYQTPSFTEKQYPIIVKKATFNAVVPFSIEGWKSSIELDDSYNDDILKFYQKIYKLANTNKEQLFNLFNKKFVEVDKALYLNQNNKREWNNLFNKLSKENFILQPFPSKINTKIYANKKIAEVTNINGDSILSYRNINDEEFNLPFLIHKKNDSTDFEIIR